MCRRRILYQITFFIDNYRRHTAAHWPDRAKSTRTRRILNRIISQKKVCLNRFVKNSVRKPIRFTFRSSGHVSTRFLFKKFVWTVRNSFAEQIFIFSLLCIQHFALFFKRMSCLLLSGPRSRFYSRVYYVSCMARFISTFGFARLCYSLKDLLHF